MKIDSTKLLKIGSTFVGVAGLLISNVIEERDKKKMKEELKTELLVEMSKEK